MTCTCLTLLVAYNKCYALSQNSFFIVTYAGMFMFQSGGSIISHPRRITVIIKQQHKSVKHDFSITALLHHSINTCIDASNFEYSCSILILECHIFKLHRIHHFLNHQLVLVM